MGEVQGDEELAGVLLEIALGRSMNFWKAPSVMNFSEGAPSFLPRARCITCPVRPG